MRRSGKFLAAALSFALVLAMPLSAQATKSGLSDAKSKKTALEAEKKKTEQELKNLSMPQRRRRSQRKRKLWKESMLNY